MVLVATLFEGPRGPTSLVTRAHQALLDWWMRWFPRKTPLGSFLWEFINQLTDGAFTAFHAALYGAMLSTAIGLALRTLARARLREGLADPLEALGARPRLVAALAWAPSFMWLVFAMATRARWLLTFPDWLVPLWALAGWAVGTTGFAFAFRALSGFGLSRLLDPIEADAPSQAPHDENAITFSAVAVTARTRGAVAAMAAASAAMVAWVASLRLPLLLNQPAVIAAIAAYVAASAGVAVAFRRRSRIAVGIDGVRVGQGFYAYADLDGARARGADLELLRNGRAVLRLQLHSDDAGRRDGVLARIQDRVLAAKSSDTRAAEAIVHSMPRASVASASVGGESYRFPALSREQLWELVEGPTTAAPTRTAAAEALAVRLDEIERSRMRIAAEHCADPKVRVALGELVPEDEGEPELRRLGT
jgi:hypothetical protein